MDTREQPPLPQLDAIPSVVGPASLALRLTLGDTGADTRKRRPAMTCASGGAVRFALQLRRADNSENSSGPVLYHGTVGVYIDESHVITAVKTRRVANTTHNERDPQEEQAVPLPLDILQTNEQDGCSSTSFPSGTVASEKVKTAMQRASAPSSFCWHLESLQGATDERTTAPENSPHYQASPVILRDVLSEFGEFADLNTGGGDAGNTNVGSNNNVYDETEAKLEMATSTLSGGGGASAVMSNVSSTLHEDPRRGRRSPSLKQTSPRGEGDERQTPSSTGQDIQWGEAEEHLWETIFGDAAPDDDDAEPPAECTPATREQQHQQEEEEEEKEQTAVVGKMNNSPPIKMEENIAEEQRKRPRRVVKLFVTHPAPVKLEAFESEPPVPVTVKKEEEVDLSSVSREGSSSSAATHQQRTEPPQSNNLLKQEENESQPSSLAQSQLNDHHRVHGMCYLHLLYVHTPVNASSNSPPSFLTTNVTVYFDTADRALSENQQESSCSLSDLLFCPSASSSSSLLSSCGGDRLQSCAVLALAGGCDLLASSLLTPQLFPLTHARDSKHPTCLSSVPLAVLLEEFSVDVCERHRFSGVAPLRAAAYIAGGYPRLVGPSPLFLVLTLMRRDRRKGEDEAANGFPEKQATCCSSLYQLRDLLTESSGNTSDVGSLHDSSTNTSWSFFKGMTSTVTLALPSASSSSSSSLFRGDGSRGEDTAGAAAVDLSFLFLNSDALFFKRHLSRLKECVQHQLCLTSRACASRKLTVLVVRLYLPGAAPAAASGGKVKTVTALHEAYLRALLLTNGSVLYQHPTCHSSGVIVVDERMLRRWLLSFAAGAPALCYNPSGTRHHDGFPHSSSLETDANLSAVPLLAAFVAIARCEDIKKEFRDVSDEAGTIVAEGYCCRCFMYQSSVVDTVRYLLQCCCLIQTAASAPPTPTFAATLPDVVCNWMAASRAWVARSRHRLSRLADVLTGLSDSPCSASAVGESATSREQTVLPRLLYGMLWRRCAALDAALVLLSSPLTHTALRLAQGSLMPRHAGMDGTLTRVVQVDDAMDVVNGFLDEFLLSRLEVLFSTALARCGVGAAAGGRDRLRSLADRYLAFGTVNHSPTSTLPFRFSYLLREAEEAHRDSLFSLPFFAHALLLSNSICWSSLRQAVRDLSPSHTGRKRLLEQRHLCTLQRPSRALAAGCLSSHVKALRDDADGGWGDVYEVGLQWTPDVVVDLASDTAGSSERLLPPFVPPSTITFHFTFVLFAVRCDSRAAAGVSELEDDLDAAATPALDEAVVCHRQRITWSLSVADLAQPQFAAVHIVAPAERLSGELRLRAAAYREEARIARRLRNKKKKGNLRHVAGVHVFPSDFYHQEERDADVVRFAASLRKELKEQNCLWDVPAGTSLFSDSSSRSSSSASDGDGEDGEDSEGGSDGGGEVAGETTGGPRRRQRLEHHHRPNSALRDGKRTHRDRDSAGGGRNLADDDECEEDDVLTFLSSSAGKPTNNTAAAATAQQEPEEGCLPSRPCERIFAAPVLVYDTHENVACGVAAPFFDIRYDYQNNSALFSAAFTQQAQEAEAMGGDTATHPARSLLWATGAGGKVSAMRVLVAILSYAAGRALAGGRLFAHVENEQAALTALLSALRSFLTRLYRKYESASNPTSSPAADECAALLAVLQDSAFASRPENATPRERREIYVHTNIFHTVNKAFFNGGAGGGGDNDEEVDDKMSTNSVVAADDLADTCAALIAGVARQCAANVRREREARRLVQLETRAQLRRRRLEKGNIRGDTAVDFYHDFRHAASWEGGESDSQDALADDDESIEAASGSPSQFLLLLLNGKLTAAGEPVATPDGRRRNVSKHGGHNFYHEALRRWVALLLSKGREMLRYSDGLKRDRLAVLQSVARRLGSSTHDANSISGGGGGGTSNAGKGTLLPSSGHFAAFCARYSSSNSSSAPSGVPQRTLSTEIAALRLSVEALDEEQRHLHRLGSGVMGALSNKRQRDSNTSLKRNPVVELIRRVSSEEEQKRLRKANVSRWEHRRCARSYDHKALKSLFLLWFRRRKSPRVFLPADDAALLTALESEFHRRF